MDAIKKNLIGRLRISKSEPHEFQLKYTVMSFTVVPVHNLRMPKAAHIEFGAGFVLQDLPSWIKTDPQLQALSLNDRSSINQSRYALVAEYEAYSLDEADPTWTGQQHKSIQALKTEAALMANLAMWLIQPTLVSLTFAFHALSWSNHPLMGDRPPSIGVPQYEPPLLYHPDDQGKMISPEQIEEAAQLHIALLAVPRKNRIWTALRAFWAGLTTFERDIRFSLFWIGLEALFGSDNPSEISYKLAQRIAFFISDSPASATLTFRNVKGCYAIRSKIVHGTWEDDLTFDTHMGQTEDFTRRACLRLLRDQDLTKTFLQKKDREKFLEEFVFSHAGAFTNPAKAQADQPEDDVA